MDGFTAPDNHFGPNPGALLNIIFQFTSGGRGQERCQALPYLPSLQFVVSYERVKTPLLLFFLRFILQVRGSKDLQQRCCSFFLLLLLLSSGNLLQLSKAAAGLQKFPFKKLARPSFTALGLLQVAIEAESDRAIQD